MRLYANCTKCSEEIPIKPVETDRSELHKTKGDRFTERCPDCGWVNELQVDDVRAARTKWLVPAAFVGVLLMSLVLELFFLDLGVWVISTVPVVIVMLISGGEQNSISSFNRYYRGRR